jgi:hypothetical protein
MPHYLRAGGYTTWILLVLGVIMIVAAARFIRQPTPKRLAFLRAMSLGYVLFAVGGTATNLTSVFYNVVRRRGPEEPLNVDHLLWGLGEAITPIGMGATILGFVWLLVALGVRRGHDE